MAEREDDVICKICGHHADHHRFRVPDPLCSNCPDRICQNGPDGRRYREEAGNG